MSGDIVTILRAWGKLDDRDAQRAQGLVISSGEPLHRVLCRLGLVAEADVARALAEMLNLPLATRADYPPSPVLADRLTPAFLQTYRVLPLADAADHAVIAMADPLDRETMRALEIRLGKALHARVAVPAELQQQIARLYGQAVEAAVDTGQATGGADLERLRELASEAPVIRLVNRLIEQAVAARASDIHVEPEASDVRIRLRIDGVLREAEVIATGRHLALVSRVKILSGLDVVERRLPQDGRFQTSVEGRAIDIRVSCLPTVHGESLVLRLLDKASAPLDLARLGFTDAVRAKLETVLAEPHGILLVTGPTGSGKTTTLHAALQRLNTGERKLITVEDPVEYQAPGVRQIQVRPQIGLEFATALRSILRHDPDVIMVGEIRDTETARVAVQAALTGHFVMATLHTNDAAGAVTRLGDMGIEPYLMTSSLKAVLAQRLVRTLCPACREPYREPAPAVRALGLDRLSGEANPRLYRARGCAACGGTGYAGRLCVAELLPLSDAVREAVLARADTTAIERIALAEGMQTMRVDGLLKALAGVTSIADVLRATQGD